MQTNSENNSGGVGGGSNEPVNVAFFKYSNELLFQKHYPTQTISRKQLLLKNYCAKCMKSIVNNNNSHQAASHNFDHDDDDDIVYFNETINNNNHPTYKNNNNINSNNIQDHDSAAAAAVCKYCSAKLNSN